MSVLAGKRPDITPAQLGLVITTGMAMLATFGLDLTKEEIEAVDRFTQALFAVVGADAVIRFGRNIWAKGDA